MISPGVEPVVTELLTKPVLLVNRVDAVFKAPFPLAMVSVTGWLNIGRPAPSTTRMPKGNERVLVGKGTQQRIHGYTVTWTVGVPLLVHKDNRDVALVGKVNLYRHPFGCFPTRQTDDIQLVAVLQDGQVLPHPEIMIHLWGTVLRQWVAVNDGREDNLALFHILDRKFAGNFERLFSYPGVGDSQVDPIAGFLLGPSGVQIWPIICSDPTVVVSNYLHAPKSSVPHVMQP